MYRNQSNPEVNMEYLWNMTNPNVGGEDPPASPDPLANSLFNITTLKTLIALGQQTPNIVGKDKDKVCGEDFNLDSWSGIAETLELNDEDDTEMGNLTMNLTPNTRHALTFSESKADPTSSKSTEDGFKVRRNCCGVFSL